MPTIEGIAIQDLATKSAEVFKRMKTEQVEFVLTDAGEPCGLLVPLADEMLEDWLLTSLPQVRERVNLARAAIARGDIATEEEIEEWLNE